MPYNPDILPRGPLREGVDLPLSLSGRIFSRLVDTTKAILEGSALIKGGEVTLADVGQLKAAHREAAKINPWIYNQGTQQTNMLMSRYCRLFGGLYNEAQGSSLNLDLIEAGGQVHDLGRWFTHRRLRNDLIGDAIMRAVGFHPNFLRHIPTDEHWKPVNSQGERARTVEETDNQATLIRYQDISAYRDDPVMGIIEMSDIMGKLVGNRLMQWEELEEVSLRSRLILPDRDKSGPREFVRMTSAVKNIDGVAQFYQNLGAWMESQIGMPIADIVKIMEDDLARNPLPPTYNQELGSFAFDSVVWDLGGVVFRGGATESNAPLVNPIFEAYEVVDPEQQKLINSEIERLLRDCNVGFKDHLVDGELIKLFGQPSKLFSMVDILTQDANSYLMDWDTVRVMKFLQNEGIRTIIASNTIESGLPVMLNALAEGGVKTVIIDGKTIEEQSRQVRETEVRGLVPVFGSYLIGARKGGHSIRVDDKKFFEVIQSAVGIKERKTLVIDDKVAYAEEGGNVLGVSHIFTEANNLEQWVLSQLS
jgi:hypothetical protein